MAFFYRFTFAKNSMKVNVLKGKNCVFRFPVILKIMKKLLFLGILLGFGLFGKAQRVYFIYLQSENAIPFYVKLGDKIHSSSTAGYLILSNLKDSVYSFSVGLAGKQQAEPRFKITIANGDRGFLIKEMDQKLALFDFHSLEVIAPIAAVNLMNEDFVTRTDNFTKTLSQAANDPSLMMEAVKKQPIMEEVVKVKPVVQEEKVIPTVAIADTNTSGSSNDSTAAVTTATIADTIKQDDNTLIDTVAVGVIKEIADTTTIQETSINKKEREAEKGTEVTGVATKTIIEAAKSEESSKEPAVKEELPVNLELPYKRTTVIRRSESSTSEGFGLTFIDYATDGNDTIRLLIPNPKVTFKVVESIKPETSETVKAVEDQSSAPVLIDTADALSSKSPACIAKATDGDFRRLRKEMAAQESDAEMLTKAKEVFRSKCFTVEQVKHLSTLFLTPESKYAFFEGIIKNISDAENVASLQSELKDDLNSNRFKALIAK
jgi:hypothetical protein